MNLLHTILTQDISANKKLLELRDSVKSGKIHFTEKENFDQKRTHNYVYYYINHIPKIPTDREIYEVYNYIIPNKMKKVIDGRPIYNNYYEFYFNTDLEGKQGSEDMEHITVIFSNLETCKRHHAWLKKYLKEVKGR